MIIGIDGNEANIQEKVGIGQYAYNLTREFSTISKKNKDINFRIYLKNPPLDGLPTATSNFQYEVFGPKPLWTQIALPFTLYTEKIKPQIFFSPSHYAPRFCPVKRAVSVMDLSYLTYPEMFKKYDLWQLTRWTEYSVKKAAQVFTISNFSKKEIIRYYHIPENRITVTYPGYNSNIFNTRKISSDEEKSIRKKYSIDSDFILFVGTIQPRKNISRLIEAFTGLLSSHSDLNLLIVGKKGWMFDDILKTDKIREYKDKIRIIDYVSDEDLSLLYRTARCFVLPSLYEGFGIPAVEAMASGCPVVASNCSSLPEVIGEAGILVDPLAVADISSSITEACFNNVKRQEMIEKGLIQARKFNWTKCAENTLTILKQYG